VSGRLDDEKLETLRGWGAGLAGDGRDELRAAGKAILILVEEIERLQVDVWHARRGSPPAQDRPETATDAELRLETVAEDSLAGNEQHGLDTTLRGRIGRLLRARAHDSG
jgi:hypothetical protein